MDEIETLMHTNSDTYPGRGQPKLRVRISRQYPMRFVVELGQRNAVFVKRPLTPLRRVLPWSDAFALLPEPDYDIIHSQNAVPLLTRRPYLITFESFLPRVPEDRYLGWLEAWLQKRLLSEQCVSLLAWSQYALRQFRWQNRNFTGLKELEAKTDVLYPTVPLRHSEPKKPSGRLKLLFVGADFMRKGGPALLRAHSRLQKRGLPVETVIVSSLRWNPDDYIGPPSEEYVRQETARLDQEGVVHYHSLPNADVLRLMAEADYFVFPTFHDTFGFAPLEALSCATPVLATDTCAQPEIVADGQCGYLLPFENEANIGKWKWIYRNREPGYLEAYDAAIERLSEAIAETLAMCWETPGRYEAMSAAAIAQVRSRFDQGQARARLEQLYERCRQ